LSKADPFAEAALSNAGAAAPKKRVRGPSLFERMTGGGRNRKEAEPEAEKVWDAVLAKEAGREAQAKRTEPRLDAAPVVKPSAAAAAKPPAPVEGNDEPQKPAAAPDLALEPEEDLLEIPAFLRRQAN
jgi:cell division protein FtsZ